jgi:hypothetical protein
MYSKEQFFISSQQEVTQISMQESSSTTIATIFYLQSSCTELELLLAAHPPVTLSCAHGRWGPPRLHRALDQTDDVYVSALLAERVGRHRRSSRPQWARLDTSTFPRPEERLPAAAREGNHQGYPVRYGRSFDRSDDQVFTIQASRRPSPAATAAPRRRGWW